jgi:hypothetical protein
MKPKRLWKSDATSLLALSLIIQWCYITRGVHHCASEKEHGTARKIVKNVIY